MGEHVAAQRLCNYQHLASSRAELLPGTLSLAASVVLLTGLAALAAGVALPRGLAVSSTVSAERHTSPGSGCEQACGGSLALQLPTVGQEVFIWAALSPD